MKNTLPSPSQLFFRQHGFALGVVLIVTTLGAIGSDVNLWLRYDRTAIYAGDYWRILTGHFVHLTWMHLVMNVIGFLLIWVLFGKLIGSLTWLISTLLSALMISFALLYFNPDLFWYVGFSGVLHGLFVIGCLHDIQVRHADGQLLLAAIVAKLAWEQYAGPLPGSEAAAGGNVIVDAHLYGAISGVLIVSVLFLIPNHKINTPPIPRTK
ncbi:MAG: rhombosortase [Thiohalomonadales bacterium]